MTTTIDQGFKELLDNLNITDLQEETVSTRQKNIRDALTQEMSVLDSFLTGSYRRSTMIAPLSEADVDVFIVLDPSYYESDGQASLLDKVKRVLKKIYPKTPEISRDGQAVTITFSDFQVDVVPGFYRTGGGYLIPDSILKRWISTDPKKHVEIWSTANQVHNGDLAPLIRMIKAWNREHSRLLRSFHLEALILQILNNVKISNFPSGVRYVFDKARTAVQFPVSDPAGYGGNVGAYLYEKTLIDEVVSRFEAGYKRAVDAEALESAGKTQQAFEKWQVIFGKYFPAYG